MEDRSFSVRARTQPLHAFGPSETWAYVDKAGHHHTYVAPAETGGTCYPTLVVRSEHVPCPDPNCGCDGYEEEWRECAVCGERIRPAMIPKTYMQFIGIDYLVDGIPVSEEEFHRLHVAFLATLSG